MPSGSDYYSGPALSGAATGAGTGALVGSQVFPGYGTLIGGLLGGGLGLFSGASANATRNQGVESQKQNIGMAMSQLKDISANNYAQYLQNINKALSFYGPATQRWNYLYGTGTGQGNFPTNPTVG